MKKFLKLLNPKVWFDNLIVKSLLMKMVKHASTAAAGIIMALFAKSGMDKFGVDVNAEHLTAQLSILFSGLAGSVMNWAQQAANEKKTDPVVADKH